MKTYKSNINLFSIKKNETEFKKTKIRSATDAYDVIKQFYNDDIDVFESSFILLLDTAANTIGYAKISQGGIVGTVIDPRLVAKYAIDSLASGVILAHNHPSGRIFPSKADLEITRKISDGLKLLDILLLDHLIITRDSFYSFSDEGEI